MTYDPERTAPAAAVRFRRNIDHLHSSQYQHDDAQGHPQIAGSHVQRRLIIIERAIESIGQGYIRGSKDSEALAIPNP
ncbi:hypothetical protein N7G274_009054 [Stereocaulon virgatum]|uniref:Uncharacterized protein n=1 Tax=Stereocaulon virgatum TaxID=373712 RepID=A0ABR3ZWU5_9LECA